MDIDRSTGDFQKSFAVTAIVAEPQALPDLTATQSVILRALKTNDDSVYIGSQDVTSSIGMFLDAGETIEIPAYKLNKIFVMSPSGSQGLRGLVV